MICIFSVSKVGIEGLKNLCVICETAGIRSVAEGSKWTYLS